MDTHTRVCDYRCILKKMDRVNRISMSRKVRGRGLINNIINKLPLELHLPGYNYCGPGTKLDKRLARGDKGINGLDEACKLHDIAYKQNESLHSRHNADLLLAKAAEKRMRESQHFPERAAAFAVNRIMKYKVKQGMGVPLSKVIKTTRDVVKKRIGGRKKQSKNGMTPSTKALINTAVKAARKYVKGKIVKTPRVIPIPKRGGFLPLIPLLGALAATGTLAGGVTTAAKNIYEMVKRNRGESATVGKGLYLKPYKAGMGLYLSPYQKKN